MESLAVRIRQSRESKGLSQKQLAEKIGVSSSAISQYESTSHFNSEPSVKNLINISKILDISVEWLMTGRGIQGIKDFLLNEQSIYKEDERLISLTKEQKEMLLLFEQLPLDWQQKYKLTLEAITHHLKKN